MSEERKRKRNKGTIIVTRGCCNLTNKTCKKRLYLSITTKIWLEIYREQPCWVFSPCCNRNDNSSENYELWTLWTLPSYQFAWYDGSILSDWAHVWIKLVTVLRIHNFLLACLLLSTLPLTLCIRPNTCGIDISTKTPIIKDESSSLLLCALPRRHPSPKPNWVFPVGENESDRGSLNG